MKQDDHNIPLSNIILGCKERNPKAQRELYDMFVLKLYNISYRLVYSREDAEDAVLCAFRRAFDKIDVYDTSRGHISNWLSKICVNESISILRKRKLKFQEIDDSLSVATRSSSILDELDTAYIYDAIQKLSEPQRIIFNLFEIEGYSHREISKMLEMKEGTCRAYLTRAKMKLREMLSVDAQGNKINIK